MIRILVVDDHPVVREGLITILEDVADFEVIGTAPSAEEALRLAERTHPDVILLDLELPGIDGVETVPRLARAAPNSRVVVFTAYHTDEHVFGAIRAGAKGYLLKGATSQEIAQAIRVVHGGGSHLTSRVATKVLSEIAGSRRQATLTVRERDVLRLIVEGQSNKQIARALAVTERTVKFHVTSILTKLGAENRAQAAALAVQQRLL